MMNPFHNMRLRLFGLPVLPITALDRKYLEDLRKEIADHPLRLSENPTESEICWYQFNERLRTLVQEDDARGFLRWDVIRKSMFVGKADYIASELDLLRKRDDWETRWQPALRESSMGRPRLYPGHLQSSGNLIHHGVHLARFEDATGVSVDSCDQVFEFGGGYGSMARLFTQLGFRGDYLIYDFPYFSALQRFYLRSIGLRANSGIECPHAASRVDGPEIWCVSDMPLLKAKLDMQGPTKKRLFLATWSISEAPAAAREAVMALLDGFDYFLIGFAHRFGEIDNNAYFRAWIDAMGPGFRWHWLENEQLPGSSYIFGQVAEE